MNHPNEPDKHRLAGNEGLALVTTILVMVLLTAGVAAMKTTSADYQSSRTFYIAEAGVEATLGQIQLALQDGVVTDDELSNITPPTLSGFEFNQFEVVKDGALVTETITDGPFTGMYSLSQNLRITSQVTNPAGTHSAVELGAKAQANPIFQFAVFFQGDLEDYAGSRKDMVGRVHTNGDLFLGGDDLHFHSTVTTPNRIHRDHKIFHDNPNNAGVWIKNGSGTEVKLTFDSDDTPDPELFKQKSTDDFGAQLPRPLTLGSEYPLYVRGDYNSIGWQPASLFGDRLGALSNAWDDAVTSAKPKVFGTPANTSPSSPEPAKVTSAVSTRIRAVYHLPMAAPVG